MKKNIPSHLGIILDGNRRWAKEKNKPVFQGHKEGMDVAEKAVGWAKKKGVKTLTLFVFSSENWKRPGREVKYLMQLLERALSKDFGEKFEKKGIRVKVIGDKKNLSSSLFKKIKELEEKTKKNSEMVLNFALSYGGRAEIAEAIKEIIRKKIPPEKISEEVVSQNLWTSDLDFLIRTGKEQRISNFLVWQAAYSELYFCKKYWPEFTEKDLDKALEDYASRKRRFGK